MQGRAMQLKEYTHDEYPHRVPIYHKQREAIAAYWGQPLTPLYSEQGFGVCDIPRPLYTRLKNAFRFEWHVWPDDFVAERTTVNAYQTETALWNIAWDSVPLAMRWKQPLARQDSPALLMRNDAVFETSLHDPNIIDLHQQFSGCTLVPETMYGPRIYQHGSLLACHTDRDNLIISSTLLIDYELDVPWPLVLFFPNRIVEIYMEAGEMLFYEGNVIPHARPTPMRGTYFANVYYHYRPIAT